MIKIRYIVNLLLLIGLLWSIRVLACISALDFLALLFALWRSYMGISGQRKKMEFRCNVALLSCRTEFVLC